MKTKRFLLALGVLFMTLNFIPSNQNNVLAQDNEYLVSTGDAIDNLTLDIATNYILGYKTKLAIFGDHSNLNGFQFYLYSSVDYLISAMGDESKVSSIAASIYRKSGDSWVFVKSALLWGNNRFIDLSDLTAGTYKFSFTPAMKYGYKYNDSCYYILISFN